MLNKQMKRRSWALYFAGLFITAQLISLIGPIASVKALVNPDIGGGTATADTSPYGRDSITDRAEKWVLSRAVAECLAKHQVGSNSSTDKIIGSNAQVGEYVGRLVEGTSSNDATVDCNPVWTTTHSRLGWNTQDTVCDAFNFTRQNGECKQGSGNYLPPSGKSNSYFVDQWNSYFSKNYLGGKSITDALSSGMRYWLYFGDFKEKCGNDQGASGFKIFPWDGQSINATSYHLPWYTNGGVQDSYVVTEKALKDADVHISGYGLLGSGDVLKCKELAQKMVTYADVFKTDLETDKTNGRDQSTAGGALASGTDSDPTCESEGGALGWIGCAILSVMDGIVGFLDSQIRSLLTVQTDALDANGSLKKSWAIMRNFAYLVLIPMMLLMVIGTAIGFGPFDPYTVKKALPRMVAATIFMSISYYLCIFLIDISNAVGSGIFHLITLAAPDGKNSLGELLGGTEGAAFSGLSAGTLVVAGLTETITWGVVGSFALVTIVALLIGYVILVIRQVLIIMLVVLSPLAILVWIFPGNDKIWGIWKTTFTAMLMMFPLIMVLIASGRFFAAVADTTFDGPTGMFIKIIAYVAPYFFIPATFKYGLGVFGNIAGMINDRSRGLFDRQKKKREATYAEGWNNFKTGGGYRNALSRSRVASRVGQGIGVGVRGRGGFGQRGQGAIDLMSRVSQADRLKDPRMQQLAYDDDANAAMYLSGGSEASARRRLKELKWDDDKIDRAVGTAKQIGFSEANALAAMQSGAQNKFRAVWENPNASKMLRDSVVEASGGSRANSQLVDNTMGNIEFLSRQAGNYHLGASDANSPDGANLESAWKKVGLYQHANGTPQSMKAFANYHVDKFKTGNEEERRKAAVALLEMQNMLPSATGDNQVEINKALRAAGVEFGQGQPSIADQLSVRSGSVISVQDLTGTARVYDREDAELRNREK